MLLFSGWTTQCKDVLVVPEAYDEEDEVQRDVADDDEELGQPLLTGANFVRDVQGLAHLDCLVVDCEPWIGPQPPSHGQVQGCWEARASPPGTLEVHVPQDHKFGDRVLMHGPHGPMIARLPAEAQPGTTFRYPLKPTPEFRMEVPPGRSPGDSVKFRRSNGEEIEVDVPVGLVPGDNFDVSPPSLIIQVPEEAGPGDDVLFSVDGCSLPGSGWYRAKVPDKLKLGRYFAAKMPGPTVAGDTKLKL